MNFVFSLIRSSVKDLKVRELKHATHTVYLIVYLVRPIQLQFQFLVCVEVLLKWDLQKITKHNLNVKS